MRTASLVITIGLVCMAGPLQADPPKSLPREIGSGRIAWFDITTSNLPQARQFYGKLFDWQFAPVQGTDLAVQVVVDGKAIGTLRVAEGKISPFNGVVYIQVVDIHASCRRSEELGGTVPAGFPFNLPDGTGAIALVVDPLGHPVGMYSRALIPAAAPLAK
jgi:predicted enzyme related to lactoylglutathione lyase